MEIEWILFTAFIISFIIFMIILYLLLEEAFDQPPGLTKFFKILSFPAFVLVSILYFADVKIETFPMFYSIVVILLAILPMVSIMFFLFINLIAVFRVMIIGAVLFFVYQWLTGDTKQTSSVRDSSPSVTSQQPVYYPNYNVQESSAPRQPRWVQRDGPVPCGACNGTGNKISGITTARSLPDGTMIAVRPPQCSFCNGTGRIWGTKWVAE